MTDESTAGTDNRPNPEESEIPFAQRKRWFMKKRWWAFGAFMFFVIAVGSSNDSSEDKEAVGNSAPSAATSLTKETISSDQTTAAPTTAAPTTSVVNPVDALQSAINKKLKSKNVRSVTYEPGGAVAVSFTDDEGATITAQGDTTNIIKIVKKANLDFTSLDITGFSDLTDKYGNTTDSEILRLTYSKATVVLINPDNVSISDIWTLADDSFIHPAYRD